MKTSQRSLNPSHQRLRSGTVFWVDFALAALAMVMIVLCLNYIAAKHPWRMLWHRDPAVMLSPFTENWVRSLTNDIRVVVFHDPDEKDTPHARIMGLLNEYRHANQGIRLEVVDYLRQRGKAQRIRQQYRMDTEQEAECLLFAMGNRHRVVSVKELTDYTTTHAAADGQLRMQAVGFKGEMLFTSAMMNLVEARASVVYFTQGHGEHDIESQDLDGYASVKQALSERNMEVRRLILREEGKVPEDAAAIVVAGARMEWTPEEINLLEQYIRKGGRALIAFNFKSFGVLTGLEAWLSSWRIRVGQNVVDDVTKYSGSELLVGKLVPHPVMNPLLGTRTPLVLPLPRSISPINRPLEDYDLDVTSLAQTTTNGVAKSGFANGTFFHNPRIDARGSIPLMTALQASPSEKSGLNQPASRMVVLGDSQFCSNIHLRKGGNRDFVSLAMNWLLERDTLLGGIGPRPLTEFRMDIPKASLKWLQWVMLCAVPLAVFGCGFLVWLKRRY